MRVPRIFSLQVLCSDSIMELEPGPSAHIARVLRMREGESILLFDGRGGQYPATIGQVAGKIVTVKLGELQPEDLQSPLQLHLGIALSRGDRMDWVVQKATELGVHHITPLFSERTGVKLKRDRLEKKRLHWEKIAISACEQSGRNLIPTINLPLELHQWQETVQADLRLVLHHRTLLVSTAPRHPSSIALLVGPEGGLSDGEIAAAEALGFEALSIGPRVLRTETAPLAAIAILQAQWGDIPLLN